MARANGRLFIAGFISLAIGLVPVIPKGSADVSSGWFILYTYPLVLGGVGLMMFAGLRSVLALLGFERARATVLTGVAMIVQYFVVNAFDLGFVVYALSFGVAFSGLVACLAIIIPMLRELSLARPPER